MGVNNHLHVAFACDNNDRVAEIARRHATEIVRAVELSDRDSAAAVRSFLTDLGARSGDNPGNKGGLSLWGGVWNRLDRGRAFVDALRSFWFDLLNGEAEFGDDYGGPAEFERVIVFAQREQESTTSAAEIFLDESGNLQITWRELPISFAQY